MSGPVLTSRFLVDPDHIAVVVVGQNVIQDEKAVDEQEKQEQEQEVFTGATEAGAVADAVADADMDAIADENVKVEEKEDSSAGKRMVDFVSLRRCPSFLFVYL